MGTKAVKVEFDLTVQPKSGFPYIIRVPNGSVARTVEEYVEAGCKVTAVREIVVTETTRDVSGEFL